MNLVFLDLPPRRMISVPCGRTLQRSCERVGALIGPTQEDWLKAWEAYERGEAGQAGLVDHVSFMVMRRLGLTQAFTSDRHFQAAGFTILF